MKKTIFPLGTLVSWFIIIGFSLLAFFVFPAETRTQTGKKYKTLSKVLVVISFLWGVVSYILSGNWSWNFKNMSHFYGWVLFTSALLLTQIIVLLLFFFKKIFKKNI